MSMTTVKSLCALEGVSGREHAVREYILACLGRSPAKMNASVDAMGSVIAVVEGKKRAGCRLMFAAHMDEVGLIITGITADGYLRFSAVGGIDPAVLYGKRVSVNGAVGVIGGKAIHQCSPEEKNKVVSLENLLIDIGADCEEEARRMVSPGDTAVFDGVFKKLAGKMVKSRAFDDRAGCALLLKLVEIVPEFDITLVFTVQEEVGLRGAKVAAFTVAPDIAVVVDSTTAADISGTPENKRVCAIDSGPVVSFMDNRTLYDKDLYTRILSIADKHGIPVQTKSLVAGGNDAGAIQTAGSGARVASVSLPCRYLHSPSSVMSGKDFDNTAKLLALIAADFADPALNLSGATR